MSSSYEEKIIKVLLKANVKFSREKQFKDLRKGRYRFDFFIEDDGTGAVYVIEVDGEYHWKPIRGRKELLAQQERDRRKNSYCLANNLTLYRVPYWEMDNIGSLEDILVDKFLVKSKWHNDLIL